MKKSLVKFCLQPISILYRARALGFGGYISFGYEKNPVHGLMIYTIIYFIALAQPSPYTSDLIAT